MDNANKESTPVFKPVGHAGFSQAVLGIDTHNRQKVVQSIREGIPAVYAIKLQKAFDVPFDVLSQIIGISSKTIHRRKEGKLKKEQSERILRLARLFDQATEVFHDTDHVRQWFKTPNPALGGESPMDYADTEPGAQEITDLLGRLEHGVFS